MSSICTYQSKDYSTKLIVNSGVNRVLDPCLVIQLPDLICTLNHKMGVPACGSFHSAWLGHYWTAGDIPPTPRHL